MHTLRTGPGRPLVLVPGADLVGSSMGGRLVLGVGRSVVGRSVVALDSGGFWEPGAEVGRRRDARGERHPCAHAPPALPSVLATSVGRTALLAQLSARPWAVDRDYAVRARPSSLSGGD